MKKLIPLAFDTKAEWDKGRWVKFPRWLWTAPMCWTDRGVFLRLWDLRQMGGKLRIKHGKLAEDLRVSISAVQASLGRLQRNGLVTQTTTGRSNIYALALTHAAYDLGEKSDLIGEKSDLNGEKSDLFGEKSISTEKDLLHRPSHRPSEREPAAHSEASLPAESDWPEQPTANSRTTDRPTPPVPAAPSPTERDDVKVPDDEIRRLAGVKHASDRAKQRAPGPKAHSGRKSNDRPLVKERPTAEDESAAATNILAWRGPKLAPPAASSPPAVLSDLSRVEQAWRAAMAKHQPSIPVARGDWSADSGPGKSATKLLGEYPVENVVRLVAWVPEAWAGLQRQHPKLTGVPTMGIAASRWSESWMPMALGAAGAGSNEYDRAVAAQTKWMEEHPESVFAPDHITDAIYRAKGKHGKL